MEVKPGYKQTEFGVIPEEWEVAPLSREVERLEAGVSVNSVDEDLRSSAHEQAVLKTSAIAAGEFLPHESKKIAPRDIGRARLNPRFDTIIISRMNTPDLVGECGYVFADFPNLFLPDRLWMTRNRPGSKACVRWLNYLLSSRSYKTRIKELATGTSGSMKNIAKDSLLAMPIAYPPPLEQRAIAEALSDVDGLLGGLDRLIAKKRDLKQAAMQQLLTGQTRLPGFHGEWEVKRLGELAEMGSGGTPTTSVPAFYDGDIPWVSISDMTKEGKIIVATDRNLSRAGFASCAAQMFPNGTVLYAMYASLGECSIAGIPLCSSQAILGIRTRSILNNDFLYYYLTSLKPIVKSLGQQGTQANLNKGMVQDFRLHLPPLPEQTAIATVLSEMDGELGKLEQRREKTRALKQAMMQELLTGRTRLV